MITNDHDTVLIFVWIRQTAFGIKSSQHKLYTAGNALNTDICTTGVDVFYHMCIAFGFEKLSRASVYTNLQYFAINLFLHFIFRWWQRLTKLYVTSLLMVMTLSLLASQNSLRCFHLIYIGQTLLYYMLCTIKILNITLRTIMLFSWKWTISARRTTKWRLSGATYM